MIIRKGMYIPFHDEYDRPYEHGYYEYAQPKLPAEGFHKNPHGLVPPMLNWN